ncbi:MAG: single-stranded-DNA-specific exonuclease RecJ [Planctomycetota bacterium]
MTAARTHGPTHPTPPLTTTAAAGFEITTQRPTRWIPRPLPKPDAAPQTTPHPGSVPPLLQSLLTQRGIADPDAQHRFLHPKLSHLDDPADLPGCTDAATRLSQALHDRQPIVVYGDYDVDGITAATILTRTLHALGADPDTTTPYIPHRLDEGYGLNTDALTNFAQQNPKPLIVTVDCGITAHTAADHAASLGLDLIITDHHTPGSNSENLPTAAAIVHPDLQPTTYNLQPPPTPLCGAGVALKLAWQTAKTHLQTDQLPQPLRELLIDLLALAALGTVADVVPLTGDNRTLTAFGLSRMKHTPFTGLNALIDAARLREDTIDAYHCGFALGPRLNAVGRLGHAKDALELFLTEDPLRAADLAQQLTEINDDRRSLQRDIEKQALEQVETLGYASDDHRVIVLAGDNWHPGVLGIVASRITERFHRPTILLGVDPETQTAKGSARSVEGVDLHAALAPIAESLCDKFGGHAMAAGLTLPAENLDAFRTQANAALTPLLPIAHLCPRFTYDAELTLPEATHPLVRCIQQLAPFGRSNPAPRFLFSNVRVAAEPRVIGRTGTHLKLTLEQHGTTLQAIGFGVAEDGRPPYHTGQHLDLIAEPILNTWNGQTNVELRLHDIRLSQTTGDQPAKAKRPGN